jgi:hypothetical protein
MTPSSDCERSKFKGFFFEKKNQKTFAPLRAVVKQPGSKVNKVFLLLFVHKKKFFFHLPSLFDLSGPLPLLKQ